MGDNLYTFGVRIGSKEEYDRLMDDYSKEGGLISTSLDFKKLFQGYPEEGQYPCLVRYQIDEFQLGPIMMSQAVELVKGGFKIVVERDAEG